MKHATLSQMIILILLYFVGYMLVIPAVLTKLTLMIDPHATLIYIPLIIITNIMLMTLVAYILRDILKDSFIQFKKHLVKNIGWIFILIILALSLNFISSVLISLFTQTETSQNQQLISDMSTISPAYILFSSCIFAPIFEECVFRGGLYTFLRQHLNTFLSILISSLLFGFIHIASSLMSGDLVDVNYLFVYASLGIVIALGYEKTNSIYASMGIHFLNNFFACLLLLI